MVSSLGPSKNQCKIEEKSVEIEVWRGRKSTDFILRWHDGLIDGKSGMMEAHHAKKWHDSGPRLVCIGCGMIGVQNGMMNIYDDPMYSL